MGKMLRCSVKEQPSFKTAALYVAAILLGVNALVMLSNLLPPLWGGIVSIGIIALAVFLTSHLINRKLAEYIYSVIDDELLIFKRSGSREKMMLKVKLQDITDIRTLTEEKNQPDPGKIRKTQMFSCKTRGEGLYVAKFQEGKHRYRFIFEPDDRFVAALKKEIRRKDALDETAAD